MRNKNLDELSDEELLREIAKRISKKAASGEFSSIDSIAEEPKSSLGKCIIEAKIDELCEKESGSPIQCPKCGGSTTVENHKQERTIFTLSGEINYKRKYFRCNNCKYGFAPIDELIGVPANGRITVEVEKRIIDFGINDTFKSAAERFSMHYSFKISENLVRRTIDKLSDVLDELPELAVQKGLIEQPEKPAFTVVGIDGSMLSTRIGWKEIKLLVVDSMNSDSERLSPSRFSSGTTIPEIRDCLIAALEASNTSANSSDIVVVSDGAQWIHSLSKDLIPKAKLVLDWPHLVNTMVECGKKIFGESGDFLQMWVDTTKYLAWSGNKKELQSQLLEFMKFAPEHRQEISCLLKYIHTNWDRIDYPEYIEKNYPIGSGVIESAHKHVLQVRMKRAGQHWDLLKCKRMSRLRCAQKMHGPHFSTKLRQIHKNVFGI